MKIPALRLGLVAALCCATTAAFAQNPFVGTWKADYAQSHVTGDTMTFTHEANGSVRSTGDNQSYSFKLDGSAATDPSGDIEHWTEVNDHTWKVETQAGTETTYDTLTLSADGKTMTDVQTGTKPNGDSISNTSISDRTTPGKGFYGTWKMVRFTDDSPNVMEIDAYGKNGIGFHFPALKAYANLDFNGKDVAPVGPTVPKGLTVSATRTGPRGFKVIEKMNGKVAATAHYVVSANGKTMTEYIHTVGAAAPAKVVFHKS